MIKIYFMLSYDSGESSLFFDRARYLRLRGLHPTLNNLSLTL